MGNTMCSCNNNPETPGLNQNMFDNENKNDNKASKFRAGKINSVDELNTNKVKFMYFLKLQRFIRKFLNKRKKVVYNKENNAKNETQSVSGRSNVFKKSGFDDLNYVYNGEYENGCKQGFGIQSWKDGAIYRGLFYENKANFIGLFEHSDGDIYQGDFKDDRACGYGIYLHANGASYEGLWLDDTQHGLGIEIWNDKSEYKGEYLKGKKSGIGSYHWADGSFYEGEWFENALHGFVRKFLI